MGKNNKSGSRNKYIDLKYLVIRERVKDKKQWLLNTLALN